MSIGPEPVQVADEPRAKASPGVNDPCVGAEPHHWIHHHPAHSPVCIPRCSQCGLINGEDIRDQVEKIVTEQRAGELRFQMRLDPESFREFMRREIRINGGPPW